jgi:predicted kinase
VRGGESLREPFLARYRRLLPDPDLSTLLPFFECYRALVRAKVHALRLGRWNDETARYFAFARRFTWEDDKPFALLIGGFSGSGKSTLARALGRRLGMPVTNSDVVRKALSGKAGRRVVPLLADIYSAAFTERTYAKMAREAEKQIVLGNGVILDATFGRRAQRDKFIQLAAKYHVPLMIIHCAADEATTERRLRLRAAQGSDVSDGRWEVYVAQKAAYEPLHELSAEQVLELDTDAPVEQLVDRCEKLLRERLDRWREVSS